MPLALLNLIGWAVFVIPETARYDDAYLSIIGMAMVLSAYAFAFGVTLTDMFEVYRRSFARTENKPDESQTPIEVPLAGARLNHEPRRYSLTMGKAAILAPDEDLRAVQAFPIHADIRAFRAATGVKENAQLP